MSEYPTEQGFYVYDTHGWEPARDIPMCFLIGRHASKYAVMRRRFCYVDKQGVPHIVQIGFPFDGLTIPRLLWRVCGHPWGRNLAAGVIHDGLCAMADALPPGERRDLLRLHADRLFAEMLAYLDNPAFVTDTWYRAVRIGAWKTRNKPRGKDYITNLVDYYDALGLFDFYEWVLDRIIRHDRDDEPEKLDMREFGIGAMA